MTDKNRYEPHGRNPGQNDQDRREAIASDIRSIQRDLSEMLVRLRKNAASTQDRRTEMLFEFAAEVVAGLSRAFRGFETRRRTPKQSEDDRL